MIIGRKSFASFLLPALCILFVSLILLAAFWDINRIIAIAAFGLGIGFIYLTWHSRKAVVILINNEGVWHQCGILPWTKRVTGIHWRDFGHVRYQKSFSGWLLKSYPIFVYHKYTGACQIAVKSIKFGDKVCSEIEHYFKNDSSIQRA